LSGDKDFGQSLLHTNFVKNLRIFFVEEEQYLQTKISHLDSTAVGRYRSLVVKDDFLEQSLAALPGPVLRKALISGILLLYAVVLYFFILERSVSQVIWLVIATAIVASCALRFKKEHAIVIDCGKAVGTVLVREELGQGRRRRGTRIKYGFFWADDKLQVGKVVGTSFMPKEGQSLAILYSCKDSSINLPLSSFWFYEFPEFSAIPRSEHPIVRPTDAPNSHLICYRRCARRPISHVRFRVNQGFPKSECQLPDRKGTQRSH
jgi:hypothetical protein